MFTCEMDIDKIQKNIEGSLLVEGAKPSDTAKKINREFLEGKITSDKAVKRIIKHWLGGK